MKVLTSQDDQLVNLKINVDDQSNTIHPETKIGSIKIGGPDCKVTMSLSDDKKNLQALVELPDMPGLKIIVEKEDIKEFKNLMNGDVLKFMIKSFM